MLGNEMKLIAGSGPIDLTWLPENGDLTTALRELLKESPPYLTMPYITLYGTAHALEDPAMLYLNVPLSIDDDGCTYACSLDDIVDDLLALNVDPDTRSAEMSSEVTIAASRKLALRLREIADKIDRKCDEVQKTQRDSTRWFR